MISGGSCSINSSRCRSCTLAILLVASFATFRWFAPKRLLGLLNWNRLPLAAFIVTDASSTVTSRCTGAFGGFGGGGFSVRSSGVFCEGRLGKSMNETSSIRTRPNILMDSMRLTEGEVLKGVVLAGSKENTKQLLRSLTPMWRKESANVRKLSKGSGLLITIFTTANCRSIYSIGHL